MNTIYIYKRRQDEVFNLIFSRPDHPEGHTRFKPNEFSLKKKKKRKSKSDLRRSDTRFKLYV